MGARAIWKGTLKVDGEQVPVKLYSAVEDRPVRFNLLEQKTGERVKQHMTQPETGKEIPSEEIRKGLEVEPGTFVVLTKEEIQSVEPEESRDIEILQFLPPEQINHQWYERPYYLGPDGDSESYFALAEALSRRKREGLARWVMRKRQYFGALLPAGGYLALIALRNADEVLLPQELPSVRGPGATKAELDMAEQLVSVLEGDFKPEEFRDEYRERVSQYLEAKAQGKRPRLKSLEEKRAPKSLKEELAKSLEALKRQKEKGVA